jgi:hypothetical protein
MPRRVDPLEVKVGGVHAHTRFLGETEVEAGNLSFVAGFMD